MVMYSFLYDIAAEYVKGKGMQQNYLILSERNKKEILDFLPQQDELYKMAGFFQNFSDSTRLKILTCLSLSDMCVNDLSKILQINQTTVSHQLQLLRVSGLVNYRRVGKILIYSLQKKAVNDIMLTAVQFL